MVNVLFSFLNNDITKIIIKDHVPKSKKQKFICGIISSTVYGFLNSYEKLLSSKNYKILINKNKIEILFNKTSEKGNQISEIFLINLQTISDKYSKEIKIKLDFKK